MKQGQWAVWSSGKEGEALRHRERQNAQEVSHGDMEGKEGKRANEQREGKDRATEETESEEVLSQETGGRKLSAPPPPSFSLAMPGQAPDTKASRWV